mgnify:CR=1 FL=1
MWKCWVFASRRLTALSGSSMSPKVSALAMQALAQQVQADFALAQQRASLRFYLGELTRELDTRVGTTP